MEKKPAQMPFTTGMSHDKVTGVQVELHIPAAVGGS